MNVRLPLLLATTLAASLPAWAWAPKRAPLMTRFAAQVNPKAPLPEYPRPQLVRSQWQNLNGIWQYQSGNEGDATPTGQKLSGEICVPFPVESALSGVMEHHDRLWYRRTFSVPKAWKGQQLKLNFGAVDYEAQVFVNGKSVGVHRGGYESFSYDIAPFLKGDGPQELIVRVFDPTEAGGQPRGKQTTKPGGIMYTPTTGIWQTVWLEPVAKTSIQNLHMVPDIDAGVVRMTVNATGASPHAVAFVQIKDGNRVIKKTLLVPGMETAIPVPNAKLWSPDSPFLYNVDVALKQGRSESDRVSSYFGMRKISVGKVGGVPKLLLNNKFTFQIGPLDQGFWPDGLYTAPTDAALRFDLEATKKLGFNMTRKHIKVEPARWYYHADKLGMLVWQDMPSPNSYTDRPAPLDKAAYDRQLVNTIKTHWNSPAIVMWVVFNEGQGRHDTARIVNMAKKLDPSRLVDRDSGGANDPDTGDGRVGDVDDIHSYPPPASPRPSSVEALVCGEYGGIGYVIQNHRWKQQDNWGYTSINSPPELEGLYGEFAGLVKDLRDQKGLSAAVYTQITDVEVESNGLLTYDRLFKSDPAEIRLANRFRYPVPTYRPILATSEQTPQTWKYSIQTPPANWTTAGFDDANWQSGQGVFGGATPDGPRIGTNWESDDIYLRRTFDASNLSTEQISQLTVRNIHDDEVEVWINGVSAYKGGGATYRYENKAISDEAKRAIVPGAQNVIAVHCHESGGDQDVDVGLFQRIPAPGRK
jgi:hypothetical protein